MIIRRRFLVQSAYFLWLCTFVFWSSVALATDSYEYGDDEYVTIYRGTAPNGMYAITAHGEGEIGGDNFRLYLTNTKTGKTIEPLEPIAEPLDTGAGSYKARWSKDSHRVVIVYRISRHLPLKAVYYRISEGHAHVTKGPTNATKRQIAFWGNWIEGKEYSGKIYGSPRMHTELN